MSQLNSGPAISIRHALPDILRGIALGGICWANYPAFSLYVFQTHETIDSLPTAPIDHALDYFHFIFVDGKFYSLFSLLFGIGFSIMLSKWKSETSTGMGRFYRRAFILTLIGIAHLLLLWSGDILMLYGLLAMLLPFFRNISDKTLLRLAFVLILMPIVIDFAEEISKVRLSDPVMQLLIETAQKYHFQESDMADYLVKHNDYASILKNNQVGFFARWQGLIDSNRAFKVFGIFLLGLYAGRNNMHSHPQHFVPLFKRVRKYGFLIGFPFSIGMAFFELTRDNYNLLFHTVCYALSVVPMSLAYTATIALIFVRNPENKILNIFSWPGRMALTNYLMQTVFAISIFYGIGLGFGGKTGLVYVESIAVGVYLVQICYSRLWLTYFSFGPMEWIWRCLTYGRLFKIRKES
ncbi:DUF418 domain-containing protein [Flavobacterium silvaticum]|uniref:DUF418 domain-containing protein n=1 Tax=Flavobacterium silvaticum TaxID=1852020 RepID=A0A972FRU6_9FLAO|nr:DUF418 domain-containing protein [Flavobacterium silvaticum]NMH26842.1 DUF418 domain-containing protein [Flavobacterium silvaticum]